jgi:hypothetical protein
VAEINYKDEQTMKQLESGITYNMQFTDKWAEYERFRAGDQWATPTQATKNLPRPVFNIIDHIENHKVASVMNENVKMIFSAQEIDTSDPSMVGAIEMAIEGADKFTRYSETTWENIKQDYLNEEVLNSASNIGCGILHYYWDTDITGGITLKYIGEMQGEFLDPSNVFFGNPQESVLQKQPYIIITKRESLQTAQDIAKTNKVPLEAYELIKSDKDTSNEIYDTAKKEMDGVDKVTIITKYWKDSKTKTILFKQVCCGVVIKQDTNTNKKLYPLAIMNWKSRKKCIYGYGDTEGLIPNQKGINFLLAMMLLSSQNTAFPKLLVKNGSLRQQITNAPGEVIVDHNPGEMGDCIKYMQTGSFSPSAMDLVDKFVDLTKTLSSAQDAQTGDISSGNLNASAIMLLQKASGVPIEAIKKRFYRFLEDVGRIWEEFYKTQYSQTRMIKVRDDDENEVMTSFTGTDYQQMPMSMKIDIGASTSYSESLSQATLDKFFDKGVIDTEQYIDYAPQNVVPFKARMKRDMEKKKQDQQMLDQQAMQMGLPPSGEPPVNNNNLNR